MANCLLWPILGELLMARYSDNDRDDSGFGFSTWFFGLLLGIVGGASLAVLFAPKSGTEIRGHIKDSAKDLPDRMSELVDDSLDLYASGVNYLQLVMEEQTMRLRRVGAAYKLAAAKKREELELGGNSSVLPFQHR
jgi:gas vesicle protein